MITTASLVTIRDFPSEALPGLRLAITKKADGRDHPNPCLKSGPFDKLRAGYGELLPREKILSRRAMRWRTVRVRVALDWEWFERAPFPPAKTDREKRAVYGRSHDVR